MDERQRAWSGLVQPSEIVHDTAIYRASEHERQRLLEDGVVIRRIRIDAELKSAIARRSETARARDGRKATEAEKRRAAAELGLPVNRDGRVLYPDAQLEYTDAEGRTGRVNVEVASGNYRPASIRAKANAGFALHCTGGVRPACSGRWGAVPPAGPSAVWPRRTRRQRNW